MTAGARGQLQSAALAGLESIHIPRISEHFAESYVDARVVRAHPEAAASSFDGAAKGRDAESSVGEPAARVQSVDLDSASTEDACTEFASVLQCLSRRTLRGTRAHLRERLPDAAHETGTFDAWRERFLAGMAGAWDDSTRVGTLHAMRSTTEWPVTPFFDRNFLYVELGVALDALRRGCECPITPAGVPRLEAKEFSARRAAGGALLRALEKRLLRSAGDAPTAMEPPSARAALSAVAQVEALPAAEAGRFLAELLAHATTLELMMIQAQFEQLLPAAAMDRSAGSQRWKPFLLSRLELSLIHI